MADPKTSRLPSDPQATKTSRLPSSNTTAPTKMRQLERLEKGARANTGGDHYDRSRGKYSKRREGDIPEFLED